MANKDKLLRDAIADAKAVRDTALANAKQSLEESFAPQLSSMLSQRLRTEIEDEDDALEEMEDATQADGHGTEDGGITNKEKVEKSSFVGEAEGLSDTADNDNKLDSSGIAPPVDNSMDSVAAPEPAAAARESSDIEDSGIEQPAGHKVSEGLYEDDDELEADGEEEFDGGAEMEIEPAPEVGGEAEFEIEPELGGEEAGEEDDLDLESILRELEADIVDDGDDDGYPIATEEDEGEEEMFEQADAEVADGHGPAEGGEKDMDANTKSTFTKSEGEKETGPIAEADGDDEEIDLEEILREIEDEEKADDEANESAQLRSELKEYRDAVRFLRSKLNEVNLLNAKLLYTNKLFRNYNMDVRGKMRVVENFDRATTVREAKLVYATLCESFKGKVTRKNRRTVTEGLASKATGNTRPKRTEKKQNVPTVLAEGADLAARMQKLAGIKKR